MLTGLESTVNKDYYSKSLKNEQYGDNIERIRELNIKKDLRNHLQVNDLNAYNEKYLRNRATLRK